MDVPSYLHMLDGRLRVKVPEMKRSPRKALHVEEIIQLLDGVMTVTANPTTGNVLVLFEAHRLTHHDIIMTLKKANYLQTAAPTQWEVTEKVVHSVSQVLAKSVAEALMERAILALL